MTELSAVVAACFREGFDFKFCCTRSRPGGEPACWDAEFTFDRCCRLPLPPPAGTLFEDVNCGREGGAWATLREELRQLPEAWLRQDEALTWLRRLSRVHAVGCSLGRLTLVVAEVLLCVLAGDRPCAKYWAHAAQAFREEGLQVVRWSATWPLAALLRRLSAMVAAEHLAPDCQAEEALDWPQLHVASVEGELDDDVWRIISAPEVRLQTLLRSGCRGGAQWVTLAKLGYCMDMSPNCVRSHGLALDLIMQDASQNGTAFKQWMEEAGAWRLYDLHYATVEKRTRHGYDLGLSVEELRWLGVLGDSEARGCFTPSFPKGDDGRVEYRLLDPEAGLAALAANRCRRLCGQAARPWRSYGVLPEVKEGAFRGIPCACSMVDGPRKNCSLGQLPLYPMPVAGRGDPPGKVFSQAAALLGHLDEEVVFVTMVFGKMAKYLAPFSRRTRDLQMTSVVVFALDDEAEEECRRNNVLFLRGEERTALQKYVAVLAFVALGRDVFWFDFDSVWLKNPLAALRAASAEEAARAQEEQRQEALIFSAIDYDSTNCAMNGFFLLRQSRGPAVTWLLALLDWILKRPFVHDQLAFCLFLGVTALVDEEPIPEPPVWAPLDPKIFANAARFEGTGFSSEVDDLVLFHFFDGWNSNSPDGVEQWALETYRGVDLFPLLYGDRAVAREAIARSKLPAPARLRDCSHMEDFGTGASVTSHYLEVPV